MLSVIFSIAIIVGIAAVCAVIIIKNMLHICQPNEVLIFSGTRRRGPDGRILGYLLGEVRAFEFNSEACGWIFSAGVDPGRLRQRVASGLLTEACRRFREAGIKTVRTMVKRNDVPVLSFFRANGFVGGSFVQLELDLEGEA